MKRTWALVIMAGLLSLSALTCGGKKEKKKEEIKERPAISPLKTCPVARIEVTPSRVEDPKCILGSNYEVEFSAQAFDDKNQPLELPLTFSLRYPDGNDDKVAGAGHRLIVVDEHRARFQASGLAAGVFTVLAQDKSCNLRTEKEPQYPEGEAWLRVYDPPGAEAVCGRMRVTYGDRQDRMNETLIASQKVTLLAEVYASEKLPRGYRVQFLLNGKPFPAKQPLHFDPETVPQPGMKYGYLSLLGIYLVPGEYRVRFELLKDNKPVCGSRTEFFRAK